MNPPHNISEAKQAAATPAGRWKWISEFHSWLTASDNIGGSCLGRGATASTCQLWTVFSAFRGLAFTRTPSNVSHLCQHRMWKKNCWKHTPSASPIMLLGGTRTKVPLILVQLCLLSLWRLSSPCCGWIALLSRFGSDLMHKSCFLFPAALLLTTLFKVVLAPLVWETLNW